MDARDPHTHDHSERVAEPASSIARELGWEAPERLLLNDAALVHDIGKIGVPDEVLVSPGRCRTPSARSSRPTPPPGRASSPGR